MHLGMPECHKLFWGHCDLTSDLVFKNDCVQSISAILFDVGIPNLGWWFLLGWRSGAYHFESLWLWHLLLASFLGFSCYITAIFPQMCLMLDQFLWGHSSRVCDISCFVFFSRWHEISNNVVCATSKGSDQPAPMPSLIRAFANPLNILWILTDLFTTTFFGYFLRFLASKYALRITIAKLRTELNPDFLSILIHFGLFQDVFLCLREVISSLIHDCVYQLVNYREQTSQLVMLC